MRRAHDLYQQGRRERDRARQVRMFQQAVDLAPEQTEVVDAYLDVLRRSGPSDLAQKETARINAWRRPMWAMHGVFQDGIELLGVTVIPTNPCADREVTVRFFWKYTAHARFDRWSVFVHFNQNGRTCFYGDHNVTEMPELEDVLRHPYPRIVRVDRTLKIPADITGEITIAVGLVDPLTRKMSILSSPFQAMKGKVVIPNAFTVSSGKVCQHGT
jgi:hypothetical protein